MDLHTGGLKSEIHFVLEPLWAYIQVGFYARLYSTLSTHLSLINFNLFLLKLKHEELLDIPL